jgi:3-oxoacyl-[acyl-carrier protein] reductase
MPALGGIAVVTGAAQGLGATMAQTLLDAGFKVVGIDINGDALAGIAARSGFVAVVADVASNDDCARAAEQARAAFGRIDILVNNAGLGPGAARPRDFAGTLRFWEADPAGWRRTIDVNSLGPFLMARAVVPAMLATGWGRIINVTTSYDTMLAAGFCAYGPSKAALEASTVLWAKELAGTGVTANVLIPGGPTDTGHPEFAPLRGTGLLLQPAVLSAPLRWLCSPASDGVTGQRLVARHWDESLPAAAAARGALSDAAWPALAAAAGTVHP